MTLALSRVAIALGVVGAMALGITSACKRSVEGQKDIDGAGASLPFPLYAKWATEFSRIDPSVRINYQPLGSGAGIRQMSDGVIDFGATDEPMSNEQLDRAHLQLVHVPMTVGAVVVAYNVPGVPELRLTAGVVADVFRGAVTRWDDPRVRETNPNVVVPSEPITVVFRSDGSGTSATFTTFLSRNSDVWRADVGAGVAPRFPVGVGARGNDGVTAHVKATPFSIGYVELAHARQANLAIALVRNRAGNYVPPTIGALDRAVRSALPKMPDDLRLSIVDSDDDGAYPIAALSFLVLQRDSKDRSKAESLARFVWWSLHEGQTFAPALHYAPLPPEIVTRAERAVRGLRGEGKPLGVPDGLSGS
ncbi:MAG TPA: phosphate ABC transporter substrate-binding protein PstS [Labilithrix sp.]|nr:phosphate ABC transporter substrate-binding protein PstS [Labilithrix sp.]